MLLLPHLTADARVLCVISDTYRGGPFRCPLLVLPIFIGTGKLNFADLSMLRHYDRFQAYCNSKLANVHFVHALHDKLKQSGKQISVFAINPGVCDFFL